MSIAKVVTRGWSIGGVMDIMLRGYSSDVTPNNIQFNSRDQDVEFLTRTKDVSFNTRDQNVEFTKGRLS